MLVGGECHVCSKWQEPLPHNPTRRARLGLGRDGFTAGSSARAGALCREAQAHCGWATNRDGTEPWSGMAGSQTSPARHQHHDSQRYFPLNSLPFSCSLVFLQNQPAPFTPRSWQLEAEAISKPMAALRGGECISTARTMQF